jgi:cysteine-rich repeat protein
LILAVVICSGCHEDIVESAWLEIPCTVAHGDSTCARYYGQARAYCSAQTGGCPGHVDYEGCVAARPSGDCHRPCGPAEASCEAADAPICGDGRVDAPEQCDDGNDVDDDGCTLACRLPRCGDGIVQADAGEHCDDGEATRTCNADCKLRGQAVWRAVLGDLGSGGRIQALAVAIADDGTIGVLARAGAEDPTRLVALTPDGKLRYHRQLPYAATSITSAPGGRFAVAGSGDEQARVSVYETAGELVWSSTAECSPSTHEALHYGPDGNLWSAGACAEHGLLSSYAIDDGALIRTLDIDDVEVVDGLASTRSGRLQLTMRGGRRVLRVGSYSTELRRLWASEEYAALARVRADVEVDASGHAYVLGVDGSVVPYIIKLREDGGRAWADPARPQDGRGLAVLPDDSGVAVVGARNRDALLTMLGADGHVVASHPFGATDSKQWFDDVAVTEDGDVVAVGGVKAPDSGTQLLVVRIAL